MKSPVKISDAEWSVMQALWKHYPATFSEIVEGLNEECEWSPKTVHTLISRLVKKGVVSTIKDTKHYKYSPLVTEDEMMNLETESFINKIYHGSVNLFVSNFLKKQKLNKNEILELKKILDENMK
ncbi:BlaI family penicillinase repressor [Clostridium acetobutylicum]|uniref:Transcriptional regulator, (BlaI/MecI subfamily) n=1 Tax=Clostridium acetobutylicum (strain ATCC 824 / DSM 792 / JCM 1419 / IAM 19013 / LMG 5710 / NBRC 13948 / NRRL B-527 / VKM B-1787 / 2291 / W) TaxID=272562 RepID=Q97DN4_CLOAB|nr:MULTISPECIES: BlaI/MecI/CopY family transcriptional regulator [Clostridium]AAK81368.1 Transcriptional regulator, (BlaI/MecI subfamily) [Clostridium acetobutylicum ATCC 824]ADZ22479.1 Transcriptional regulator, (BlaI/MecI subfamily) [Clostridium acetobutylicum EA 2018]AEI33699.1 BlaI/MecI subfamily transcriptional regulator [Clostridium acetobutylicum DSM 1731]AWV80965.1 transcriptional regulator [Clostridium acetobutylicum]MBC2393712.1 transcriptional regulator [Clostridium acetobutylicum]